MMTITKCARHLRLAAALATLCLVGGCATLYWNEEVDRPHARKFEVNSALGPEHTPGSAHVFCLGETTWYELYDGYYIEDPGAGWALLRDLPKRALAGLNLSVEPCAEGVDLHHRHEGGPEWLDTCRASDCYLADLYLLREETLKETLFKVSFRGADGLGSPRPLENRLAGPRDHLASGAIKSGYLLSAAVDAATLPASLPAFLWLLGMAKGYQH